MYINKKTSFCKLCQSFVANLHSTLPALWEIRGDFHQKWFPIVQYPSSLDANFLIYMRTCYTCTCILLIIILCIIYISTQVINIYNIIQRQVEIHSTFSTYMYACTYTIIYIMYI